MHDVSLTQIDFCSEFLYALPNTNLHGPLMIPKAAVRIIVILLKYSTDRINPKVFDVNF